MNELLEIAGQMDKEKLYDRYYRIVEKPKDYDKISKKKMIEAIFMYNKKWENITAYCTYREIKFLEKMLNGKIKENNFDKFDWEVETLLRKYIITIDDLFYPVIFSELEGSIKEAISKVDWKELKYTTSIVEVAVAFAKCSGTGLMSPLCNFVASLCNFKAEHVESIENMLICYPLFRYYVAVYDENHHILGDVHSFIFNDYYDFSDEIDEIRTETLQVNKINLDKERYITLFYNDFDIRKPKIKEFCEKLYEYPFIDISTRDAIKEIAALNLSRDELYDFFEKISDEDDFIELLNIVMDDYPAPVFNGLSLNEYKNFEKEKLDSIDLKKNLPDQENAHLNKKDCDLFYKIYFALLQFTNNIYNVKSKMKIYKQLGIVPEQLVPIVDKFWENKDELIDKFIKDNIYKFKKEELDIVKEFKKGIKGTFFIVTYEKEYTAFQNSEKTFMVKGLNCNIDKIVDKKNLPIPVETVILPFKKVLVFDGIIREYQIDMNLNYNEFLKEYNTDIKYYHM